MHSSHSIPVPSPSKDHTATRAGALLRRSALTITTALCAIVFQAETISGATPENATEKGANAIQKKTEETIIPKFELYDAKPEGALQVISTAIGVRISYTPRREELADVNLSMANVPASEALRYVAKFSFLKVNYKEDGIDVLAERRPPPQGGPLEKKAEAIHLPEFTFKNATPAEVLQALSAASGIKVFYIPAEWDQPNQTFHFVAGAPAWGLFFDYSSKANLRMIYREDAIYFVANPYARNGFQTPGTVEYAAETTAIPMINWKGIKPAEAFKDIATASGIPIFYTPRPADKPGLPQMLQNASVALLLRNVAYPAGLRISYQADGVHLAPGDPNLNEDHANARLRRGLPMQRDLALEASPEFKAEMKRRLDGENAAMLERFKKASVVNVGDPAPDFTCRTVAGEEINLSQMKDKVVVLHFFANNQRSWDTVQRFEKEILQKYGARTDIQVLAIFCNLEAAKLEELVKQKKVSYPIAADPKKEILSKYGSSSERTYVIGKDGKIKQCVFPSLVNVLVPPGNDAAPVRMDLVLTAESIQGLTQTVQKELAAK